MSIQTEDNLLKQETARRIREAREGRGWSQSELARYTGWTPEKPEVGVSPQAIGNYEQGQRIPHRAKAQRLGEVFQLPPEYFTGYMTLEEAKVMYAIRSTK